MPQMEPALVGAIRKHAGLSLAQMADVLRVQDRGTIHRWEKGLRPISGPASVLLELIAENALPSKYYHDAGIRWEKDGTTVPGPAQVAMRFMLRDAGVEV